MGPSENLLVDAVVHLPHFHGRHFVIASHDSQFSVFIHSTTLGPQFIPEGSQAGTSKLPSTVMVLQQEQ